MNSMIQNGLKSKRKNETLKPLRSALIKHQQIKQKIIAWMSNKFKIMFSTKNDKANKQRKVKQSKRNKLKMKQSIFWSLLEWAMLRSFLLTKKKKRNKTGQKNFIEFGGSLSPFYLSYITCLTSLKVTIFSFDCPMSNVVQVDFSFCFSSKLILSPQRHVRALSAALYHYIDVTLWVSKCFVFFYFRL